MKFKIEELKEEKDCFEIDLSEDCIKRLKAEYKKAKIFCIAFDALNLGTKLYGGNRAETKAIQKANYRQMTKLLRQIKRAVRFLRKRREDFDGTFYVHGLADKKNNNDLMLVSMLELKFNVPIFKRYDHVISFACDYIDKENSLNQMCGDFKDNKCRKQQELNLEKVNGCCVNPCKFKQEGKPCPVKCLSCKLFMCSYLENLGYCFYINYIPILRKYFTFFERFVLLGCLFRSEKQTKNYLLFIRFIYYVYILMIVVLAVVLGAWLVRLIF